MKYTGFKTKKPPVKSLLYKQYIFRKILVLSAVWVVLLRRQLLIIFIASSDVQGWDVWGPGQPDVMPDLIGGNPAHGRRVGTK